MEDLFGENGKAGEWLDMAVEMIMLYAPKVILAIITLVVGLWLINRLVNVLDARLKARIPASTSSSAAWSVSYSKSCC